MLKRLKCQKVEMSTFLQYSEKTVTKTFLPKVFFLIKNLFRNWYFIINRDKASKIELDFFYRFRFFFPFFQNVVKRLTFNLL